MQPGRTGRSAPAVHAPCSGPMQGRRQTRPDGSQSYLARPTPTTRYPQSRYSGSRTPGSCARAVSGAGNTLQTAVHLWPHSRQTWVNRASQDSSPWTAPPAIPSSSSSASEMFPSSPFSSNKTPGCPHAPPYATPVLKSPTDTVPSAQPRANGGSSIKPSESIR